jgi:hypothetical protein
MTYAQPQREAKMLHAYRLETTPLANSVTAAALFVYAICRVISIVAPDALAAVARSWSHGLVVGTAPWPRSDFGELMLGFFTLGIFVWVFTAATAWLYKQWAR